MILANYVDAQFLSVSAVLSGVKEIRASIDQAKEQQRFGRKTVLFVDEVHIATLATHPDFRRQGIAQKLLTHTLRYTSDEGAVSSFLEVRESNLAAQEMYCKFGYENTGRRKRYYKDNDEDAILMTLSKIEVDK